MYLALSMPITNMWRSCSPQSELIAILPIRVANLRTIRPTHFGCSKFQKIHPTDITLRTLYIRCAVLAWNHNIPIIFWIRWIKYIGPTCSVCCDDLHKLPLWRLQRWLSLVGCTQAPLVYNYGNHQLKSPNFVDNLSWFSQRYYGSHSYSRL